MTVCRHCNNPDHPIKHGTLYGYSRQGCKCEPCRAVKHAQSAARAARAKEERAAARAAKQANQPQSEERTVTKRKPDLLTTLVLPDMRNAACKGMNTDLFMYGSAGPTVQQMKEAKRICGGCSERFACLQFAIENKEAGLWAGTTEEQRRRLQPKAAA